ncbi:hypothetical protein DPX16_8977 [Anabarilius grahami]|uniref:Uncharacterized protein n=1 Tax=Anabarilius grahami TaxID=495550 RepID=A0A3N0XCZ5_ANAGA|nr:hypothetical protein DPX16_8977 [Anabarilius grahami]
MARRNAVVQAFQFDPESDPDGEAPDEEVATQRLQQDVSECQTFRMTAEGLDSIAAFIGQGPPKKTFD